MQAAAWLQTLSEIFPDDLYVELTHSLSPGDKGVIHKLAQMAQVNNLPVVASNDVRYATQEDYRRYDLLSCIRLGIPVTQPHELRPSNAEAYLKTEDDLRKLIPWDDAFGNTELIANQCHVNLVPEHIIPPSASVPKGETSTHYLGSLCRTALPQKYLLEEQSKAKVQLEKELAVISDLQLEEFFLVVHEVTEKARHWGIRCAGRGSAANSIVAYLLGITAVDPIRYNLLFERFLHKGHKGTPDIDIDFAHTGRDKVLRYVVEKYGEENVSQVITFGTMGAKAVVRDVGRVLGMPFGDVDRIAKLIPAELKMTLDKAIDRVPELQQMANSRGDEGKLIEYARRLEGMARHASVHACAVIIAPTDLTDYVPLYCAPKDGTITTQFVGETCMDVGLLKMDFLGLKELSLMDEAERLIRLKVSDFDLGKVPWDDRATFDLFGRGETIGVFQFESGGMREYLSKLKPDNLEDIIAMNALYRPGPMENIPTFIARKSGKEEIVYPHPKLEEILEPTYGIMVYQEQVMRIAQVLAGFSMGQADILRKAMGKKKPDEMAKVKKDFVGGCVGLDVDKKIAEDLFADIEIFAGYAFNKSHAACYSEVAYKNAYLKANHPKEYMAASLTMDRSNTDRLTILLDDCRRMGMPVLPPDINQSTLNFTPTDEGIRYGLSAIKNVGEGAAQSIVETRVEGGPMVTLFEFCERIDLRAVNRRVVENLVAAGALDGLEGNRAQKAEALDLALKAAGKAHEEREKGQISLFDTGGEGPSELDIRELPAIEEWPEREKLGKERELLGFYISSHPLKPYARDLQSFAQPLGEMESQEDGAGMRVGGLVDQVRKLFDRRGNPFAFVTLEDLSGKGDIAFFSEAFAAHEELLVEGETLLVEGKISDRNGRLSLRAEKAMHLETAREQLTKTVNLSLPYEEVAEDLLGRLRGLCERHMGNCELVLHLKNGGERDAVVRSRTIRVNPCNDLLRGIDDLIGPRRTWLTAQIQAPTVQVGEGRRFGNRESNF